MPGSLDERTLQQFFSVPRRAFIKSTDLTDGAVTRTIPSQAVIRSLLSRVPALHDSDRVLMIGIGSGYLATVLSKLVAELVVVELHEPVVVELHEPVADIARHNMEPFDCGNVLIRSGDGVDGAADLAPFDLIIVVCALPSLDALFAQLTPKGVLIQLEDADGMWGALKAWQRGADGTMHCRDVGVIQFDADIGDTLIDLEVVDQETLRQARQEAERTRRPLMAVLQLQRRCHEGGRPGALHYRLGVEG